MLDRMLHQLPRFRLTTLFALTAIFALCLTYWDRYGAIALLITTSLSFVISLAGFLMRPQIPNSIRRTANVMLVLICLAYISFVPATRTAMTLLQLGIGGNLPFDAYGFIYRPISGSVALLPKSIQNSTKQYIDKWLPDGKVLRKDWPNKLGWSWRLPDSGIVTIGFPPRTQSKHP